MKIPLKCRWQWLLALVFLGACSSTLFSSALSGCSKQQEPIKIGLATTLTGPASTSGVHSRNTVTLAVEQLNQSGGINGRQIRLIVKDDKGQADEAVRIDRELIEEGVVAIIGHYLSSLSVKAVPYLNERQVLMISPGSTSAELTGLDDFFIRVMMPDDQRARLMAAMAYQRLEIKKMAVIYDLSNPNYTVPLSNHFQNNFLQQGGLISAAIPFNSLEQYSAPDMASKLITSGADGILLITNAINGALLCQHLRKIKPEIEIIASPWTLPESDFIRNGGRAVEGVTCLVELDLESSSKKFQDFKELYQRRFAEPVSINGYAAYEAAQILFQALAKTEKAGALKEAILAQGRFAGLNDDIVFDKFGDPNRPLYILEIQDSEIRTVGKMEL